MALGECWLLPTLTIRLGRAALIKTTLSQPKGAAWCLGWKFQSHLVDMYFFFLVEFFWCLFNFFFSPRRPIHISLVVCKMRVLSSLALVMHFLNFKNPSLQKLIFLVRVLFPFVCFQTTQQLFQNIMTLGCAFHRAVSKKSLRSTWTSTEAIQRNSSFSCTFLMAQPEDKQRNNIIACAC